MASFKVLSNLLHDGRLYKEGDMVELSEEEAEALLEGPTPTVEAPEKKDEAEAEPEESKDASDMTRAELNEYASGLGIEDPEGFANKAELLEAVQNAEAEPEE